MRESAEESAPTLDLTPVDLVEPLVDAANSRWFFFNSATRPFGMVNLSPDNQLGGAWGSGYRYNTDTVRVFSHIHAWQLSGVPVMPLTGAYEGALGPEDFKSRFSHETEIVEPGYHRLMLERYGIGVELTATTRVGMHRYTFPASEQSHVVIDLSTELGPSGTRGGRITRISDQELAGHAEMEPTIRRPKPVEVYFTILFDKPFDGLTVWQEGEDRVVQQSAEGDSMRAYVSFRNQRRRNSPDESGHFLRQRRAGQEKPRRGTARTGNSIGSVQRPGRSGIVCWGASR